MITTLQLLFNILSATLLGTTLMTMFSYYASRIRRKQFREPELLNELLVGLRLMDFSTPKNHIAGWAIHYTVGLLFIICYALILHGWMLSPTFGFFAIAGGISGLIGVAGWHITLTAHPNPPPVHMKEYYVQLFAAHVLFGIGAFFGYGLTRL